MGQLLGLSVCLVAINKKNNNKNYNKDNNKDDKDKDKDNKKNNNKNHPKPNLSKKLTGSTKWCNVLFLSASFAGHPFKLCFVP